MRPDERVPVHAHTHMSTHTLVRVGAFKSLNGVKIPLLLSWSKFYTL